MTERFTAWDMVCWTAFFALVALLVLVAWPFYAIYWILNKIILKEYEEVSYGDRPFW